MLATPQCGENRTFDRIDVSGDMEQLQAYRRY
jgi:hypothetical protein